MTGASGFLGRRVVSQLTDSGWQVTATGRVERPADFPPNLEYVRADLVDPSAAERLSPWRWDAVANLAGPVVAAGSAWEIDRQVVVAHVSIALNVIRAAPSGWAGRFVHASSMTVYGPAQRLPVDEAHARRPSHLYGLAKRLSEDVIRSSTLKDRWVLRFPGLFSSERCSGGLFHFVQTAQRGESIRVTATSPTPWDVLDVEDAATAILRALSSSARDPGFVNVAYGEPVELRAMAGRIAAMASPSGRVEWASSPDHPVFQMDVGRAQELLQGWPPATLQSRLERLWTEWGRA